jgi:orotidine-5'-phosphate decarboxylase
MQARDRLIVAADLSTGDEILGLADELHDAAGVLKIGLQAFVSNGPALVREIVSRDIRVFLDLKLHDIPNTVQNAVAAAEGLGVAMLTVHAAGGGAMLRAAVSHEILILAVTVLTSLDDAELARTGFAEPAMPLAVRLARLAKDSGLRGAVTSPLEIAAIREACGREFTIVAPGIRPAGAPAGDQRRTLTPEQAVRAGADYIVVGRPITGARDRRDAALRIVDEMKKGGS